MAVLTQKLEERDRSYTGLGGGLGGGLRRWEFSVLRERRKEKISWERRMCEKNCTDRKESVFIPSLLNPWSHGSFLLCSSALSGSFPSQEEDSMIKFQVS